MKLKFKFSGNWMNRFLDVVEKGGNVLPHPATLFALMALSVIVLSGVAAMLDISAIHPGTGETIKPVSLSCQSSRTYNFQYPNSNFRFPNHQSPITMP